MTVPPIETMSAEERGYRGIRVGARGITITPVYSVGQGRWVIPPQRAFDPKRRLTGLEARLLTASNAIERVV